MQGPPVKPTRVINAHSKCPCCCYFLKEVKASNERFCKPEVEVFPSCPLRMISNDERMKEKHNVDGNISLEVA